MANAIRRTFYTAVLAAVMAVIAATAAWAQTPTPTGTPAPTPTPTATPAPTPTPDLAAIYSQYVTAVNRGDAAGAAAFFADDGVFIVGGCPADTGCVGRAAIQARTQRTVDGHFRFAIVDVQVSGNTIVAREEHRGDPQRAVGIERVVAKVTLTFRGDKIVRRVQELDLSDPLTAKFIALTTATPTPAAAPTTGVGAEDGSGPWLPVALATLGGLLLVAGAFWSLRRRSYGR